MADDLDLDVEDAPKGGGKKLLLFGIIGGVVLIGALVAVLFFAGILGGGDEPATAEGEGAEAGPAEEEAAAAAAGPVIYQPLEPPFVVNFSADSDVRFMQITLQVADRRQAVIDAVKEHSPAIRNALVLLFSSQDPEVLNTREGKENLRQQALEEIRKVLKEQTGKGELENLYFTSFVMQ